MESNVKLFLTAKEVDELNYQQCCGHLRLLKKTWDFERSLQEYWQQVWPIIDPLCDTILYLEDRIARYEDPRIASMDMSA